MMDQENTPYEPPKSTIEPSTSQALPIEPAARWLRFANLFLDYIAFTIISMILGIAIALLFGEAGLRYLESLPDIVVGAPIVLGYYLVFEGLTGRTLGKFITGTRVVNEQGLEPTFGQILGRTFSRIIPFEAFSFLGPQGRGWHDSLPGTYVVRCR